MIRNLLSKLSQRVSRMTLHKPSRRTRQCHARHNRLFVEQLEARTLMSATPTAYLQTNLISDQPGVAAITDSNLVNAWGLALPPTGGNFWIADNETGLSSVYGGDASGSTLTNKFNVSIPGDGPTGTVFNGTSDFVVHDASGNSGPAAFIFVTEDGTISGWNANVGRTDPTKISTTAEVGTTVAGAIYKGVAIANNNAGNMLYAANFHTGQIDVFDTHFAPKTLSGNFTDPKLPAGYAPFNIQNIGGVLYVTFAQQDAAKEDEVAGQGKGFVDRFDANGHLLGRFATRGELNAPWGLVQAPASFGQFSRDILVGNFGNGHINAYTTTGHFAGALRDASGKPVAIDGLWALAFGNGTAGDANALYFTAGPDDEAHGLFGKLTAATNLSEQTDIGGVHLTLRDTQNNHYVGTLELKSHGKSTISGTITIIFDRWPDGATLNNRTGVTASGKPYITLTNVTIAKHNPLNVMVDFNATKQDFGHALAALHHGSVVQGPVA